MHASPRAFRAQATGFVLTPQNWVCLAAACSGLGLSHDCLASSSLPMWFPLELYSCSFSEFYHICSCPPDTLSSNHTRGAHACCAFAKSTPSSGTDMADSFHHLCSRSVHVSLPCATFRDPMFLRQPGPPISLHSFHVLSACSYDHLFVVCLLLLQEGRDLSWIPYPACRNI